MTTNLPNHYRDIAVHPMPPRLNRTEVAPTESAEEPDTEDSEIAGPVAKSNTPVLITEQEVVFGTAAATALPRTNTGRQWAAVLRRVFTVSATGDRPAKPVHHPRQHDSFLEQAALAREMFRL
jgi:hypothetical protein